MKGRLYRTFLLFLLSIFSPLTGSAAVSFSPLFSFNGTNGAVPEATLVQGADGFLYGTTIGGGTNVLVQSGYGTVFRISTNADFSSVLSFTSHANPQSGVVQAGDGYLYGVTDYGADFRGNFYRLTPDGQFTELYVFDYSIGGYPHGVTLGPDGAFYGTGMYGGTDTNYLGTIFKITSEGVPTLLASFHGTNGSHPQNKLLLARDGNFYGTTPSGGAFDLGTVFRVTPTGVLTTLVSFDGTNGTSPYGALMQARDGLIYGTAYSGGIDFSGPSYSGNGTVFTIDTNGLFATRYQFKGYPNDASRPGFGGLLQGVDGFLYGTSESGGIEGSGTIFRLAPVGTEELLYSFSRADYQTGINVDGWEPTAGLTQVSDGTFYGVTMAGGAYASGVIFRFMVTPDPPVLKCTVSSRDLKAQLTWAAIPGWSYEVQAASDLAQAKWETVTQVLATNSTATVFDSLPPNQSRFYRLKPLH